MNLLLSIAQLAKSTYYYWVKKLDKPDKYSKIKQEITAIVKESRNSYGYRRVTLALKMKVDLSQYLGHILVETVKPFFLLLILQIPVGLDSESSYGFDFGYKILQCS